MLYKSMVKSLLWHDSILHATTPFHLYGYISYEWYMNLSSLFGLFLCFRCIISMFIPFFWFKIFADWSLMSALRTDNWRTLVLVVLICLWSQCINSYKLWFSALLQIKAPTKAKHLNWHCLRYPCLSQKAWLKLGLRICHRRFPMGP